MADKEIKVKLKKTSQPTITKESTTKESTTKKLKKKLKIKTSNK